MLASVVAEQGIWLWLWLSEWCANSGGREGCYSEGVVLAGRWRKGVEIVVARQRVGEVLARWRLFESSCGLMGLCLNKCLLQLG